MIAVDTNVLVYAHRDGFPLHARALERLGELAGGTMPWAVPVFCIGEFCRVVTHPRVLSPPTPLETALAAVERLLAAPTARLLLPGDGFPARFADVARAASATGNLAFDAQIAAVCLEHGVTELLTADRDFSRCDRIRIVSL